MKCPRCDTEATQVGVFWVCPEHGPVSPEKPIAPLRIFLSYGHDVWFDKNEIKFGDDWRHSITDGILKSNRVLSFLSKHSTRDPGVCRAEIAIAIGVKGGNIQTVLVESEESRRFAGEIETLNGHLKPIKSEARLRSPAPRAA